MEKLPTSTQLLVQDLEQKPQSFDRDEFIRAAKRNKYHDFLGESAFNINELVLRARRIGFDDIAIAAMNGKYDATKEEADEWQCSPEGRAVFAELVKGKGT